MIIIKKIKKKKNNEKKSKLTIWIQFVYMYICLHGLLEPVCCFDIRMDFVK